MCGILGTVDLPFGESVLDTIRHRGPDGSGLAGLNAGRHRVTLGHRRLAILDLSPAGHQPMFTPSGRQAVVFNGEIYNHLDLRAGLGQQTYRGHCDTETALYLMTRKGVEAAAAFNGIFALAFVDLDQGKLFLVRDRFGIKPLYYWAGGGAFAFSSEIRALSRLVEDDIDPEKLAELLSLRYLPAPDTLFRNIHKVRPGHIVEVDLRALALSWHEYPYQEPEPPETVRHSRSEALERYAFLLEQAIRRQLLSDVEVGVLLSGGIDSALVARFAQGYAPYRMKAFTVGFKDREDADEIAEAAETAAMAGLEHHHVRIGYDDFVETLPRINSIIEEPLATTSSVPMFHLAALASRHVKVVLSGQGADEVLGGYRRYQAELLRPYLPRFAAPALARIAPALGLRNAALLRGVASIGEQDDVERFRRIYSVFTPGQILRLIGTRETLAVKRIRYFFDLLGCAARSHSVERMMSLDLRMNLADDLLLYTDKITMHHALECRVPLLDLDLVRYLESLPFRHRVGLLHGKKIEKRFARFVLPETIVNRPKKGFLVPASAWFRKSGLTRELLLASNSRFSSYFDLSAVARVITEHDRGMDRERELFLLLSIHYWLESAAGTAQPARAVAWG